MSLFGSQGPSKKIVIKVRKCSALKSSEEVRKVVLNAADEPMTLDELCLMCQRIFHLPPSSQVSMKYIDADGDLINLTDNSDLVFALIDSENYLKVNIYQDEDKLELRGDQVVMSNAKVEELKSEMKSVVSKLSSWIEQLDNIEEYVATKPTVSASGSSKKEKRSKEVAKNNQGESVAIKSGAGKEFDPLQQQQQQIQNSFDAIPNGGSSLPEKATSEGSFGDNQVNDLSLESSTPVTQVNSVASVERSAADQSAVADRSNNDISAAAVPNTSGSSFTPNVYPPVAQVTDQLNMNNLDVSQLDDPHRNSAAPSPAVDNMQGGVSLNSDQNSLNKQTPPPINQPPSAVNNFPPGNRPSESPRNFMPPFMPPNGMGSNVNFPGPPPQPGKPPVQNQMPPPTMGGHGPPPPMMGQAPPPGQFMGPNFGPPPPMTNGAMPPPSHPSSAGSTDSRPPSRPTYNGGAPPPSPSPAAQGNMPGPPPPGMMQPPFSMAGGVAPPPMSMMAQGGGPPSMNIPRGQMMYPGGSKYQPPLSFNKGSSTPLQTPGVDTGASGGQMNNQSVPPPMTGSPFMPPTNYPAPRGSSGMPPPPASAAGPAPPSGAPPHQQPYGMGGQMMNPMMRMPGPPPPSMPGMMPPPSHGGAPGNPMMHPPPMGMAYGGAPGAPSATAPLGGPPSMMPPPPTSFTPSM